jgi:hypothetical protein
VLSLVACSDSGDGKPAQPVAATPAQQQQPASKALSPAQQQAVDAAKGLPKQGTVTEMMHAAGYTYMNVDTGTGKPVWIAATMMRVKNGNTVQWADAAVMRNFNSKSLHRTFDEILFVSNASVIQ